MTRHHQRHRVLVVGGGVAGLHIASALGRRWRRMPTRQTDVSVTLLDRSAVHVWKPMLHTIAAGTKDVSQQQTPYLAQARDAGFMYQPGEMCGLDRAQREVLVAPLVAEDGRVLTQERRLGYDTLVLALGSQANEFGTPGAAEHCWRIDSVEQADGFNHELRLQMLLSVVERRGLNVSIVGGGATGVELAAELVQLTEAAEAYGADGISARVHIRLIESGTRLLASFDEAIAQSVKERLGNLGVEVLVQSRVAEVSGSSLTLTDGRKLPSTMTVWAAGVKAPDFLSTLDGLYTNSSNQLLVDSHLRTSDPFIYAVGDCSALKTSGSTRGLPPTAQVAQQQANYLVRHMPAVVCGKQPSAYFRFRDKGALVSLADYDGFAALSKLGTFKGATLRGRLALLSHAMLYRAHQSRLHGFWRGGLMWLVDILNGQLRARIRLD